MKKILSIILFLILFTLPFVDIANGWIVYRDEIVTNMAVGSTSGIDKNIGSETLDSVLDVREIFTDMSKNYIMGIHALIELNPSSTSSSIAFGSNTEINIASGNAKNFPEVAGADNSVVHKGSGTITEAYGANNAVFPWNSAKITTAYGSRDKVSNYSDQTLPTAYGSWNRVANMLHGTITNAYGTYSKVENVDEHGTIDKAYGIYSTIVKTAGTINTAYGVYIPDISSSATTHYAFYSAGTSSNFFGGVIITPDGTVANPAITNIRNDAGLLFESPRVMTFTSGGYGRIMWQDADMIMSSDERIGWTSGAYSAAIDTSLTRVAAGVIGTQSIYPTTDNTYYLGKNDDDTPFAWKGMIFKDQGGTGKYYRLEVFNDAIRIVDLTD